MFYPILMFCLCGCICFIFGFTSNADDVESCKALAFPEAAEGDLKIVAEHVSWFYDA
jgi:hypothetical protein